MYIKVFLFIQSKFHFSPIEAFISYNLPNAYFCKKQLLIEPTPLYPLFMPLQTWHPHRFPGQPQGGTMDKRPQRDIRNHPEKNANCSAHPAGKAARDLDALRQPG